MDQSAEATSHQTNAVSSEEPMEITDIQNLYRTWLEMDVKYHCVMRRYDAIWNTAPEWFCKPLHSRLISEKRRVWCRDSGLKETERSAAQLFNNRYCLEERMAATYPQSVADVAALIHILYSTLRETSVTEEDAPIPYKILTHLREVFCGESHINKVGFTPPPAGF